MKKAAIYARVSTDRQEKQRTIESQLAELRDICRNQEVDVVGEYIDDGYSGATLVRPGLDRLRDEASKGIFEAVYILSPDRLARKYLYQLVVIDELRKRGTEVVFLDRPVTDRPEDQLMLGIQGVIAEYERTLIVDRSRRGKLHRARNGEFMGGSAPYGYDYVHRSKDKAAHIRPNERESEVVRQIFSLYLQGMSTISIAKELMNWKIKTRRGLDFWHPALIHRILTSETYTGTAHYNKRREGSRPSMRDRSEWIPIKVPAIIDEKSFRLVQQISKSRRRTFIKKHVYILSGLLRCRHCGSRYSGFRNSAQYFY